MVHDTRSTRRRLQRSRTLHLDSSLVHEARTRLQNTLVRDFFESWNPDITQEEMLARAASIGRTDQTLARTPAISGWTPLHQAVWLDRVETIRTLLSEGVDLEAKTITGRTALHVAADIGNYEVTQILLEAGADPEDKCLFGFTPSGYAKQSLSCDVLLLLADYVQE